MIPPEVSLPGPFNTNRRRTALAAYPLQVRAMISVRGRTRTGTLWFQTTELHGLRLSVIIQQLTHNAIITGRYIAFEFLTVSPWAQVLFYCWLIAHRCINLLNLHLKLLLLLGLLQLLK